VKARYDYLPFGEEVTLSRSVVTGFGSVDSTKQKFTSKERDMESGLDYFLARYYSSAQGRFTSPDEFTGGPRELWVLGSGDSKKQALPYAEITNPQTLNKYQYCLNNPIRYVDPNGHQQKDSFEEQIKRAINILWAAFASDLAKQQVGSNPEAEAFVNTTFTTSNGTQMTGRDIAQIEFNGMIAQGEQLQTILDLTDPTGLISGMSGSLSGQRTSAETILGMAAGTLGHFPLPGGGSIALREAKTLVGRWAKDPVKDTISASIRYHYGEHGAELGAKSVWQYLRQAQEFANNLKGAAKRDLGDGKTRYWKNGRYIILDSAKRIISFGLVR
jgi:RHS repeat-associated protein